MPWAVERVLLGCPMSTASGCVSLVLCCHVTPKINMRSVSCLRGGGLLERDKVCI